MLLRIRGVRWWVASAVLMLATHTEQRGDGAPSGACLDMTPAHSDILPQASVPPYVIITSSSQVHQGGKLNVTISSPGGATPIGGFILQARQVQDREKILGKFTRVPDPMMEKIVSCRGDNDTVTHTSPEQKRDLTFEWQAPNDFLGGVAFKATVAQDYATFWKNVESSVVELVSPNTVITTTARATTTRGSITQPAITTSQNKKPQPTIDPIYQGCADTKLCFGSQTNCVNTYNCPAVVAVLVAGDTFTFEVQAVDNPVYVAAGLSLDTGMGDDSAMECVQINGKISLHSSWTYPKVDPYVTRKNIPQDILRLVQSSFNDGKLYCKFTRDANTTVQGVNFDLVNKMYNLMIVAGSSMKDAERVGFHDKVFEKTGAPLKLAQVGSAQGASKLLLRLHGAFMVAAWLGTASIGIVLARYFRQTWVGRQLGGKDIWFAWHRIFMILTWLLTIGGFTLILVEVGGYTTTGDNPHAITGLVTVILCFLQPIGAYFRPHPGTSKRPVFNWLHWLGGNAAHILGIATIFLAVYLTKSELPGWTVYILAAFVVFHVVMHLILSLTVCVSDGRISNGRVNSFPMKDMMGNARQPVAVDRKTDAPYSGFRRILLAVYIPIIALFAIAVICLVALAPITETYNSVSDAFNKAMGADGQ